MIYIDAILTFLSSLLPVIGKAIPPDEIRIGHFDIKKPRLSQKERVAAYDREYRRLINHPEIEISKDVAFVDYNLTESERDILIENLTDRVFYKRSKHPILFKKFLQSETYKAWEAKQPK